MVTPDAGGAHNVRGGSSRILKKQRAGATRPNISGVCFVIGDTFVSAVSVKSADSGYPILELDRVGKARLTRAIKSPFECTGPLITMLAPGENSRSLL